MKYLLILAAILFTACAENPSAPSTYARECTHRFESAEPLTILSDSTYAIGSHEYVAPPDTPMGNFLYTRSGFMRKIESCYNDGLTVRGEMTRAEVAEHVLNLCITPEDEIVALMGGYELPKPISVTYLGADCRE